MVPSIGTKGIFSFAEPYASLVNEDQEFTVVSIRAIPELQASGEQPFETIYTPVGESESVFIEDLKNNVPIITLKMDGGEYFYVPANKILSDAKQTGIKYIEKSVMVNLGYIPLSTDLTVLEQNMSDLVYDTLGIRPVIKVAETSAVVHVSKDRHTTLKTTRDNITTVDKSWKTRYMELLELYNDQKQFISNIEEVYINNGVGG